MEKAGGRNIDILIRKLRRKTNIVFWNRGWCFNYSYLYKRFFFYFFN
jgi:hypothetical protein